uniref:Ribosomal protein L11 n=1 Tax=Imasa heleensis TaxID=2772037 RepID=A0A893DD04_9EUKA|nr:ribosomal protein L11 [Imasa heleensis]QRR29755.1 ribosomal protein L11 [Imasa heleensis]
MNQIKEVLSIQILANKANPSPPLGPVMGQRGINIVKFCKEFNNRSMTYIDEIPLKVTVYINKDNTYHINIDKPTDRYFASSLLKYSNTVDIRYIYEYILCHNKVSKLNLPVKSLCKSIINYLKTFRIKVI